MIVSCSVISTYAGMELNASVRSVPIACDNTRFLVTRPFRSVEDALIGFLKVRAASGIFTIRSSEIHSRATDWIRLNYKYCSPISVNRRWQEVRESGRVLAEEIPISGSERNTTWLLSAIDGSTIESFCPARRSIARSDTPNQEELF